MFGSLKKAIVYFNLMQKVMFFQKPALKRQGRIYKNVRERQMSFNSDGDIAAAQ